MSTIIGIIAGTIAIIAALFYKILYKARDNKKDEGNNKNIRG